MPRMSAYVAGCYEIVISSQEVMSVRGVRGFLRKLRSQEYALFATPSSYVWAGAKGKERITVAYENAPGNLPFYWTSASGVVALQLPEGEKVHDLFFRRYAAYAGENNISPEKQSRWINLKRYRSIMDEALVGKLEVHLNKSEVAGALIGNTAGLVNFSSDEKDSLMALFVRLATPVALDPLRVEHVKLEMQW